jgi:hypothetical protein
MKPHRHVQAGIAALCCIGLLPADSAFPHSLAVPFFRDNGGTMENAGPTEGGAALISVANTRDEPITMYIVYGQKDGAGGYVIQQAVPYQLGAKEFLRWRPAQDDPAEGVGRRVPNVLAGLGAFGSVTIYWIGGDDMTGAIVGQYREFTSGSAMMHVLFESRN